MIIENIYLENFRNYESQKIKLSPGKNIFFGLNGQGKTNVIEAIYYFCTCKSFRSIHDKEIIRFDSDYSHIRIDFSDNKRKNTADIYITDKKSVKVNGINLEKLSEIIGSINMVIFTPEHLNLVREGPGTRRNFLDVLISQIKPMYFKYLMNYYKVLKQRNNILKNRKMLSTIEVWDEKLVQYGVKICEYRKEAINRMNKFIEKFESENEKFSIEYSPSIKNNFTDLEVFLSQLKSGLERDIEKGMTREQVAKKYGYENVRSMDQLMRRRGYKVCDGKYVKEEKKRELCVVSPRSEKLMNALNAITQSGGSINEKQLERWGFDTRQQLNDFMKEEGIKYDPINQLYHIVTKEQEVSKENYQTIQETKIPVLPETPEKVEDYLPFLEFLYDNKAIFDDMVKDKAENKPPVLNIPGKCHQKTFHINSNLACLINQFADAHGIKYKNVVEAAVIQYLEKYGYEDKVAQILHRG